MINPKHLSNLKHAGFAIFVLPALWIIFASPFAPGLSSQGHMMVSGMLITIGLWVMRPLNLPLSIGGLFLACFSLLAGLKPATVFSGFTQPAIWTLIPALFFGTVLHKTGLGKRIALRVICLFRPSYPSLIAAWAVIGVVLSAFTPSITVRIAIMTPVAVQCCELCELKKNSKGNSLIMLTAFAMALLPGGGWLTGSLWGPIIQGMFGAVPEMANLLQFHTWSSAMLAPMVLTSLLLVVAGCFALRPEDKLSAVVFESLRAKEKTRLSRDEKSSAVILLLVFAFFITGRLHSLPDAAVCLAAVVAFFALGVLKPDDISTGISWDTVVYISMSLGLGAILTEAGVSNWLSGVIVPALRPIAGSEALFILVMFLILHLWHFIDIAFIPTMAVLIPVLPAINAAYGIDPLIWIPLFVMAGNSFFMAYQNMWAVMATKIAGTRSWQPKHLAIYGAVYFVACLIAAVACLII